MWTEDDARQLLVDFAEGLGLDGFGLDADGHGRLLFDQELAVDLDYDRQRHLLQLTGRLGRPSDAAMPDLCPVLLRANGFAHETGIALGLEGEDGEIVQLAAVPLAGLDLPGFEARLESFARMALDWRRAIAAAAPAAAAPATHHGPGMRV
jgi:hypothetical protein